MTTETNPPTVTPPAVQAPAPVMPLPAGVARGSMFKRLEKKQGKIRVALVGVSGSGKTYSAMLMAEGIREQMIRDGHTNPRIAIIDTENNSAADYANKFELDGMAIKPPFTVAKYISAMQAAVDEGYEILILDSGTHAWAGEGGLLDKKAALDARPGTQNQYTNWGPVTADHRKFLSMIVNSQTHLIVTLRGKTEYALEKDERTGKTKPVKIGIGPDQRAGLEYEFQVVFDIAMGHTVAVNKDRTGLFGDEVFVPTRQLGIDLYKWRMDGKEEEKAEQESDPESAPVSIAPNAGTPVPGAPWVTAVQPIQPVPSAPAIAAPAVAGNGSSPRASIQAISEITRMCRERGTTLNAIKGQLGMKLLEVITEEKAQKMIGVLNTMPVAQEVEGGK